MKPKTLKSPDLESFKAFNTQRVMEPPFHPIQLNVKLTSNPFLKDQEKFHYLVYRLNDYNRRVASQQVTDPYQSMSHQKLHSIVCDLAYIETREDQLTRLEEAFKWFKEQEKLMEQRKDQGYVRYEVTKEVRHGVEVQEKQKVGSEKTQKNEIPHDRITRQMKPFKRGWRTTHKELDLPIRRLNEYKRKIINIAPFIEQKEQNKAPKIIYPKVEKLEEQKEEDPQEEKPEEGAKEGEGGQAEEGQENQQQDLGGFGQEPEQPEEEEKAEEQGDKLKPRFKNYTTEFQDVKRKEYKSQYAFYRGEEAATERRMEERYLKGQNDVLKKQKQDHLYIEFTNERAEGKSKMQKMLQKTLQLKKYQPKYSFSKEPTPRAERLSQQEQVKFGFTTSLLTRPKYKESLDFSDMGLPKIDPKQENFDKSLRRDQLKSLKNKFGKMLNLAEYEQRETSASLCQHTARKRGFSQIIKYHTKSRERLHELDEVARIKEKLTQNKAVTTVDIKSLSMGLCAPEGEKFEGENKYPNRDLPSNPFMVDVKKKKKKK